MEAVINTQQDRCKLIHAIVSAPVGSVITINGEHMNKPENQQAYIAVTSTGFVDGACATESKDAAQWKSDMESAGMHIECVSKAEAKRVLFTLVSIFSAASVVKAAVRQSPCDDCGATHAPGQNTLCDK